MTATSHQGGRPLEKGDPIVNPNALHMYHKAKRGAKGVPSKVISLVHDPDPSVAKNPGHSFATTSNIYFKLFNQRKTNATFGYEHFVSLPPRYEDDEQKTWPLILFLHGSGESQRTSGESYSSVRHGIPKMILCYDRFKADPSNVEPSIDIPRSPRFRKGKGKQNKQGDNSPLPVSPDACASLAENFITVCPSLNLTNGYGWNAAVLDALLDELLDRYRIDPGQIHLTGFSMGGYGVWELALHRPERFASLMPVCGGADSLRTSQIKHIPHWIHHGALDDIIPAESSQQMYDALKQAGATNLHFTIYENMQHDCWTAVYNNRKVYEWMLENSNAVAQA